MSRGGFMVLQEFREQQQRRILNQNLVSAKSAVNREMCPVEGQNWSMEGNIQKHTIRTLSPWCFCDVTYLSGLWVCLACVILIAGCDTVSGLTITNIPSSSLQPAAQARSVTSERPEVGLTTAGKYLFGRSSNVIPTPYAFTTPMNEIHIILWSDFLLTCITN